MIFILRNASQAFDEDSLWCIMEVRCSLFVTGPFISGFRVPREKKIRKIATEKAKLCLTGTYKPGREYRIPVNAFWCSYIWEIMVETVEKTHIYSTSKCGWIGHQEPQLSRGNMVTPDNSPSPVTHALGSSNLFQMVAYTSLSLDESIELTYRRARAIARTRSKQIDLWLA